MRTFGTEMRDLEVLIDFERDGAVDDTMGAASMRFVI